MTDHFRSIPLSFKILVDETLFDGSVTISVYRGCLRHLGARRCKPAMRGRLDHLFFADDLILLATKSQARVLRHTLCEFCNGQRVSLSKSQVFVSPNTSRDVLNQVNCRDACHKELGEVSWRATNS